MFYIEKRRVKRKDVVLMHIGPTVVVFLAFFGLTIWSWIDTRTTLNQEKSKILTQNIEQATSAVQGRLANYEDILRAADGLFGASEEVTPDEWKQFVTVFDVQKRYPELAGVGYAKVVKSSQTTEFVNKMQGYGLTDYHIFPDTGEVIRTPVTYAVVGAQTAPASLGFDMYSESNRRAAMNIARDTGQAVLTAPLQLLQDKLHNDTQPSYIVYMPFYDSEGTPSSQQERQESLQGYVFVSFRSNVMLSEILPQLDEHTGIQIFHTDTNTSLYESSQFQRISTQADKQFTSKVINVDNTQWTIASQLEPSVLPAHETQRLSGVLWGGITFSIFVSGFIYLLLLNRTRALAQREAGEIQHAKDELLALASHQLRTPATGVKQYIGMLREGYAGTLSNEQKKFVDKAFASNERQLGTINEMLVVAKADAGHLQISKTIIDVNDLIGAVIEEQMNAIEERGQTINSYMPSQPVHISADPTYVRMAVENVLSNATKYTPEGGTLTVTLLQKKGMARIIIRDTGVGVTKTDYPMLFQKFSRIPNELTSKVGGSGIGLYLAKKIVEEHQGTITFESELGVGSVCTIILPGPKKTKR